MPKALRHHHHPRSLRTARAARAAALALSLCGAAVSWAEERVKILFLPPPMEGTLSLGIYNKEGKLVRTLHNEDGVDAFHPALNGLITHWDGNDDDGTPCPAGKYRARGYMVGDLKAEGIDYHGNDWYLDDDSPRLRRLTRIAGLPEGRLLLEALQPGSDTPALFIATPAEGKTQEPKSDKAENDNEDSDDEPQVWKATPAPEGTSLPVTGLYQKEDSPDFAKMEGVANAIGSTIAPNGHVWGIDGQSVKEFTPSGEADRELLSLDESLRPLQIAATERYLFVLVGNDTEQRLRGLPYENPGQADVDTAIVASDTLEQAKPLLAFPDGSPFEPAELLKAQLIANPLLKDEKAGQIQLKVALTPEGSQLATQDGLPLLLISDTPHLRWVSAGQKKGKGAITLFESDGAVIAEYRIARPGQMMAFDAGTYKWKGKKTPPKTEVDQAPESDSASDRSDGEETTPEPLPSATPEPSRTAPSDPSPEPSHPVSPEINGINQES